jgi:hypothetical protein
MASKFNMEKQDRIQDQLMRQAKYPSKVPSATQTIIAASKVQKAEFEKNKAKAAAKVTSVVYLGGHPYNMTPEQAEAIKAKTQSEIENREANKAEKRKAKAAKTKAKKAQAKIDAEAAAKAKFNAMIAAKAQEQIKARKNK